MALVTSRNGTDAYKNMNLRLASSRKHPVVYMKPLRGREDLGLGLGHCVSSGTAGLGSHATQVLVSWVLATG